MAAGSGVDAGIPKLPEGALTVPSVAVSKLQRTINCLIASADAGAMRLGHAFSAATDFLVTGVLSYASFNTHLLRPLNSV